MVANLRGLLQVLNKLTYREHFKLRPAMPMLIVIKLSRSLVIDMELFISFIVCPRHDCLTLFNNNY